MKRRDTPASYARGIIEQAVAKNKGRTQWATAVTIWPFLDTATVAYGRYIMDVVPGSGGKACLLEEAIASMVKRLLETKRGDLVANGDRPLVTALVGPMIESATHLSEFVISFDGGDVWTPDKGPVSDAYFVGGAPNKRFSVNRSNRPPCPDAIWRMMQARCFSKEQHAFIDQLYPARKAAA